MKKNPNPQSGFFNPRVLFAFTLCSTGVFLAMLTVAATTRSKIEPVRPGTNITATAPSSPQVGPCSVSPLNDQCPSWLSIYDNPAGHTPSSLGYDKGNALAMSPDGNRVYITGSTAHGLGDTDFGTIAYDTAMGQQIWVAQLVDSPTGAYSGNDAFAIAASPDGSSVYVTGSIVADAGIGYATVAYDAGSGRELWVTRYLQPFPAGYGVPVSIAVSPGSDRVYVTGTVRDSITGEKNFATVAYDTVTGSEIWAVRFPGPFASSEATSLRINRSGTVVFVTGNTCRVAASGPICPQPDYATIAYDAATGNQMWLTRYSGPANSPTSHATALAISPSDDLVYVTGGSDETPGADGSTSQSYATLAYRLTTGEQVWEARYTGLANASSTALTIAISRSGQNVYVTGGSCGTPGNGTSCDLDYATVAYDAKTGAQKWAARYASPGSIFEAGNAIVVSPTEDRIYVTGYSGPVGFADLFQGEGLTIHAFIYDLDYATVAYDATNGSQLWAARYNSSLAGTDGDIATSIGVNPNGSRVFVAGTFVYGGVQDVPPPNQPNNYFDDGTMAYETGSPIPVPLTGVVSRKVHGSAGPFDVDLPANGNFGIECRSGGANGNYTLIFTFANSLASVGGASVTGGTGNVTSSSIGNDAHQYIVDLTGVTNAQVITVSLTNVSDTAGNSSGVLSASMGVLIGDTSANGSVNSSDISQTKAQSGTVATSSNFRTDVTVNGLINSSDISTVKSKSGTALP